MFNNSTDAYQSALKIMGHDYANKYANYWSKKNKTIKSGKANFKDSGRQKTYKAQFKKLNWKETVKYCKKIAKSKTYKKLCENTIGSSKGKLNVTIEKANFRHATAGQATWYGAIRLKEVNCPYTIIHEFAHLCGNMHHDIGFRRRRVSKMLNSRLLLAIISCRQRSGLSRLYEWKRLETSTCKKG